VSDVSGNCGKKIIMINEGVHNEQKKRYDEDYFLMYKDDPKRMIMYKSELTHIESFKSSGKILDIGCGIGHFLSQFSDEKWERYGVDVSELAIKAARSRGIRVNDFENAYDYPAEYFDVIVFRGSLQLIPDPFAVINRSIELLKSGGIMVFLSTPNSNSPYYKRFNTLPFLTPHANFLIPSDLMMRDLLQNYGMKILDIRFPYWGGPYARPIRDYFYYFLSFLGIKKKFPFRKSSMEIYAQKP
jgi:SAM-dependent methyltransferase